MMKWELRHPKATADMLGHIPDFVSEDDPRPARQQFDANYQHGGGWTMIRGFAMLPNGDLHYTGDPPYELIAEARLRDEVVRFYRGAFVAIVQADGTFEVARLD
jgi:hypothetical protein